MPTSSWRSLVSLSVLLLLLSSCSIRQMAIDELGNALAGGGTVYASDDDPELVGEALPFALKTIESLLAQSPRHEGLLLAAASGFTQYSWAFVQEEADEIESENLQRAQELRARAKRLYIRARDYGLRGLEIAIPGGGGLRTNPEAVLKGAGREDVPLLYWTALAWGGAISIAKDDIELSADLGLVEQIMHRAKELDESYESGGIDSFYISWEGGRPAAAGGSLERAQEHFDRAVQLSGGTSAGPYVTYAETVSISTQNREQFQQLLEKALAIEADKSPEKRLANLIYQRRARWLLSRADELFLE